MNDMSRLLGFVIDARDVYTILLFECKVVLSFITIFHAMNIDYYHPGPRYLLIHVNYSSQNQLHAPFKTIQYTTIRSIFTFSMAFMSDPQNEPLWLLQSLLL